MNTVTLRTTVIGEGTPKICLPIVGTDLEDIIEQARSFRRYPCDIAEWRADWFDFVFDHDQVQSAAHAIREVLGDIPLLFTFRTKEEGGEKEISEEDYLALNCFVAEQHLADALDIELFRGDAVAARIIACAHTNGVAAVISNHNFTETPSKDEILSRLKKAQALGGDVLKIAVMPNSAHDVLTLLDATEQAHCICQQPLITMSMGALGAVSRISGEIFGSSVTFGAAGAASAPGQIDAETLADILQVLRLS